MSRLTPTGLLNGHIDFCPTGSAQAITVENPLKVVVFVLKNPGQPARSLYFQWLPVQGHSTEYSPRITRQWCSEARKRQTALLIRFAPHQVLSPAR